jgi:hydroxymethylpyrimidine pyrophosphatase-like HAD family hydrolase
MTIAFDVDGTLVSFKGSPQRKIIFLYKTLQKLGCTMIIWSVGGKDYAKKWAKRLKLDADYVLDKLEPSPVIVDIAFDDDPIQGIAHKIIKV